MNRSWLLLGLFVEVFFGLVIWLSVWEMFTFCLFSSIDFCAGDSVVEIFGVHCLVGSVFLLSAADLTVSSVSSC